MSDLVIKMDISGKTGQGEPAFCSLCNEFQERVVWVMTPDPPVVICDECSTKVAMAHIQWLTIMLDSRA